MKKFSLFLSALLVTALFAGCYSGPGASSAVSAQTGLTSSSTQAQDASKTDFKVALLIPGTLGDKSFFDSASAGMKKAEAELGVNIKVIEMGTDRTKYEPTFRDVCAQDWNLIVSGSPDMTDVFNEFCGEFPNQKFMNYDASNDTVMDNVYSVSYAANELSYLSGVVAALTTTSDMEHANKETKIGFIGGMDIPGINDFLVGYIQGAADVNPDIKVIISYAQDFANPGKGKELATNQYDAGADIIFGVAGGTGLGGLDAAADKTKYAIGVDSDQAALFAGSDDAKANLIVTSAIKRIDQVIFNAIEMCQKDELPVGTYAILGFAQEGVGIARNAQYEAALPNDIKTQIDEYEQKLIAGEIEIVTAVGMSQEDLDKIRNSVA